MTKTQSRSGQSITLKLASAERQAILGFLIMDEDLEERLMRIPSTQGEVRLTVEDGLALYGWLNAPGNQTKDEAVQHKLDRVCDRIRGLLPEDAFED